MKIRIKFAKRGPVKYVGHLDMLRYFQKLIRRAEIDICYSEGFNPHQKMSFAAPLGVGVGSEGEYVDIEVHTSESSDISIKKLNAASVEGIEILSWKQLPDTAANAMSSVAAADYFISYREGYEPDFDFETAFTEFLKSDVIEIEKETKKSTAVVNIRPMIYQYKFCTDSDCLVLCEGKRGIKLQLATGSVNNLKPELVFAAFYQYLQKELPKFALSVTRLEVYGNKGTEETPDYQPLEAFGMDI